MYYNKTIDRGMREDAITYRVLGFSIHAGVQFTSLVPGPSVTSASQPVWLHLAEVCLIDTDLH